MVARTPLKQGKIMVAPLSPTLIRETVKKVDQCMERLQELQYTVTGGNKVVSGVKLSPRSTKAYLKTSLRCKQEFARIKTNAPKKSPTGKLPANATGEWRRMSLPAMLLNETVAEILQATQFTKHIMETSNNADPKTPLTLTRKHKQTTTMDKTPLEARRKREKQHKFRIIHPESRTPLIQRARSRINFKESPPKRSQLDRENTQNSVSTRYLANRVSPKHKPWAKKTVLFPNPLFHSSPTSQKQQFCKTKSPIIAKKREIPHKFIIKSPVKIKNSVSPVSTKPTILTRRKSPPKPSSTSSRLRRSLSPSRLANRLVSPLKTRRNSMMNVSSSSVDGLMMNGLKQKPPPLMMMPMRFSNPRIVVGRNE